LLRTNAAPFARWGFIIMAERADRAIPYVSSPALAHALPGRRVPGHAAGAGHLQRLPHYLLFGAVLLAFLVSAGAVIAPQVAQVLHRPAVQTPAVVASHSVPALGGADLANVLSYVQQMRADDTLVQVRPGIFAKQSNVQGVDVGGRTVFYDVVPHQSYGPLRAGRVIESEVDVLAREHVGDALVLVYTLK
jgi:hypothetical protein